MRWWQRIWCFLHNLFFRRDVYKRRARWRVVAASVQGSRHERLGQPCQDAYAYEATPSGALIVAVADGAGSARYAQQGAQSAVQAVREFLRTTDCLTKGGLDKWRAIATQAIEAARRAIAEQAQQGEATVSDFATTLIGVVATPHAVATVQIGDGAVVLEDAQGQLHLLTHTRLGEYLNETVFITSEGALQHARFEYWEGEATHLAIFTDGLELLALQLPDATPYPPFFQPLFRFVDSPESSPAQLEAFLRSERVRARTDDDLTLVLIGREGRRRACENGAYWQNL